MLVPAWPSSGRLALGMCAAIEQEGRLVRPSPGPRRRDSWGPLGKLHAYLGHPLTDAQSRIPSTSCRPRMYCNPSADGLLEAAHDAVSGSRKGQRERLQALGPTKDPGKVPLL